MSFLAWFFTVFFVLVIVGSILGPDDRPYMKRPEDKTIRMAVGSWFHGLRR